ncbi:MAG: lipoyl(octanoyl) transferase LipB [Myxococcales bacterium]|nr:MAG: lipoyl(octanoyl) transferase LipB [Myxococcales bacterium]
MSERVLRVRQLGRLAYGKALMLQQRLHEERIAGRGQDTLLLVEHDPVITLGRAAKAANVLLSPERLKERGVELFETGRGGDVTYHGPGQVVAYPIVNLKPERCDVRRYVSDLEECMIRVCAEYGISAGRIKGLNGTWVAERKIGAVGVRISRWVTMHGLAFNVHTNLKDFEMIVPFGIADKSVTSLSQELRREVVLAEVQEKLARNLASILGASLQWDDEPIAQPDKSGIKIA